MKNKPVRSSLVAANKDRAAWCAALPRPAASQRQSGRGTVAVAKAAEDHGSRTTEGRVVIDYVVTLSGSTNSETYTNGGTYFVSGPVYVNEAGIQCGSVFKYPNNTPAFLDVEETLTITPQASSNAVFTAGDDTNHGQLLTTSIWSNYTGNVHGHYGNPDLEVYDWSSVVITNFSFYYASNGLSLVLSASPCSASIFESLFTNCLLGISLASASGGSGLSVTATACTNVNVTSAFSTTVTNLTAALNSCLFSNITQLVTNPASAGSSTWTFTNCTAQNVTNFGASSGVTINNGDFTVGGYGAVGNGLTNDQPAISNALQAAVNWCAYVGPATLYFHAGDNYFLNTVDSSDSFFLVPPVTNLTLASDSATSLATLSSTNIPSGPSPLNMIAFNGPAFGIVVSNLIFTNTHGLSNNAVTGVESRGLFFDGPGFQSIQNVTVTGCTFAGWEQGLLFYGSSNCWISSNSFLFPMGLDSGTTNHAGPNVGIALGFVESSGVYDRTFSIYSNYFNGLSGTNSVSNLVVHSAGDGFLNAQADGVSCYSNAVYNNAIEGILIESPTSNTVPGSPCYVSNNLINKEISPVSGMGIVCNVSGSQINSNTIINCTYGLEVPDYFWPNPAANITFCSNNVTVASVSNNYTFALTVGDVVQSSFFSNAFTLNLSSNVTQPNTNLLLLLGEWVTF
jgi:hypothetical protein